MSEKQDHGSSATDVATSPNGLTETQHSAGWRTFWDDEPFDGRLVWTFGTLHRDGIGEIAAAQVSRWDRFTKSWVSAEWGSHEPSFWAPYSSEAPPISPKAQPECRDGQYADEPKPIPPPPLTPRDGVAET